MIYNNRYFNFCSLILIIFFISSSSSSTVTPFCSNLTSTNDRDAPCFHESSTNNPGFLRSLGSNLVLPCHVANSKLSNIEWWYQDFQKTVNIKIYPVFPAVRPTVLRFITTTLANSKDSNETDVIDVSVLLRHVNVDDSGIYRCIIRPGIPPRMNNFQEIQMGGIEDLPALAYHVELAGPRLCQASLAALPCFGGMRTSSPTVIDAYETGFLQCVVPNYNRPVNVFWVVGNASSNSVLITDYLATNQHNGDRLRRIFPVSPIDYSIELTINRDIRERTYSCVIAGTANYETTLFTYVVRSIDLVEIPDKKIKTSKNQLTIKNQLETEKSLKKLEKLVSHDALTPEQIDELHEKNSHEYVKTKDEKLNDDDDDNDVLVVVNNNDDLEDIYTREEGTSKH